VVVEAVLREPVCAAKFPVPCEKQGNIWLLDTAESLIRGRDRRKSAIFRQIN
jgi:hypothetical protein